MSAPIQPAGVSLDVVGTLLFPHPSVGRVYARAAGKLGHHVDAAALEPRFEQAMQATRNIKAPRSRWDEVVDRTFSGSVPRSAVADLQLACWEAFGRGDAWRMARGAPLVIAQLRFLGLKVCALSNADERMREVLDTKGLASALDAILLADGSAPAKPDAGAFGLAARRLGCDIARLVHVGDDLREDAMAASSAGAIGIWLSDQPPPEGVRRVARLTALPELLRDMLVPRSAGRKLTRARRNLIANLRGQPEERGRSAEREPRRLDQAVEEAVRKLGIDRAIPEHAISAAWTRLLPPALARRTAPLRIQADGKLMVQCEGGTVRSEAMFHAKALLGKVRDLPGCGHVRSVGFVVA